MGNICSKSANKESGFSTPGRPLGSSSASNATPANKASVPAKVKTGGVTTGSQGRTLGSASAGGDGAQSPEDARRAAARAAEERANAASKPGGKLKSQLDAQKKKTQNQVLSAGSEQERLVRAADENTQVRTWN